VHAGLDDPLVSYQQIAAAPPRTGHDGGLLIADELRKLAALRDEGILTDAEFAGRKQTLLARGL
jgi:putative oligomerization/nucleic acid binding protein